MCKFKFTESNGKFNSKSNGADTAYILNVYIHKNVLIMFQQKLHLLVNRNKLNFSVITGSADADGFKICKCASVLGLPTPDTETGI